MLSENHKHIIFMVRTAEQWNNFGLWHIQVLFQGAKSLAEVLVNMKKHQVGINKEFYSQVQSVMNIGFTGLICGD